MKLIINGVFGRMGKAVAALAAADPDVTVVCGVDIAPGTADFPVTERIDAYTGEADVIIDFSHHSGTVAICDYAAKRGIPVVIATTGHTEEEKAYIAETAKKTAVFASANMSLGVALLCKLCKEAAAFLDGADIEIIEKHHNKKLDAPSGTALMIADGIKKVKEESFYVFDRSSVRRQREKAGIGIHAVRAGNIVGEHEVLFALGNEHITISHSAFNRELFADGAFKAARFLVGKTAGFYNMEDLVASK